MKGLRILPYLALIFSFGLYTACDDDDPKPGDVVDDTADVVEDQVDDPIEDPVQDPVADPTEDPTEDVVPDEAEDPVVDTGFDLAFDMFDMADMYEPPLEPVLVIAGIAVGYDINPGDLKWVQLVNIGDGVADLSNYSLGNYNNGGLDLGGGAAMVLAGTLLPCESFVVNYENNQSEGDSHFLTIYGTEPDWRTGGFINGDDTVALFLGPATGTGTDALLIDVYGTIGVHGDDTFWDYTDSFALRVVGEAPVFDCTTLDHCSYDTFATDWEFWGVGYAGNNNWTSVDWANSTNPFDYQFTCP